MERSLIAAVVVLGFVGLAHGVALNGTCTATATPTTCDAGLKCSAASTPNKCLRLLGGECATVNDCYVIPTGNGQCSSAKMCACVDKYVTNYNMDTCKLKAGEICTTTNNDCAENSMCLNNTVFTCTCNSGYTVKDGRCAKAVNEACSVSTDCGLMAECNSSKKCACKSPYVTDGTSCKSGAGTIFGSILTMLAFLVTSRIL